MRGTAATPRRDGCSINSWSRAEEVPTRDCACGCGESTTHDFVPDHELRAIQARVREHFGGSVLSFITWLDNEPPPAAPAA
ncbi:hypothetical protein CG747_32160 [Streptomyces sp. CB02959]|nr:hypothetical protein CG747_32160 [Streptomyces sp. CB02959]